MFWMTLWSSPTGQQRSLLWVTPWVWSSMLYEFKEPPLILSSSKHSTQSEKSCSSLSQHLHLLVDFLINLTHTVILVCLFKTPVLLNLSCECVMHFRETNNEKISFLLQSLLQHLTNKLHPCIMLHSTSVCSYIQIQKTLNPVLWQLNACTDLKKAQ